MAQENINHSLMNSQLILLERMLSRIDEFKDKREGSIIYDAMAPASVELSLVYMTLDWILKNTFEYLE